MFLSRLCKLKIVSLALLPYLVLAIGSELLHNHDCDDQLGTPEYWTVLYCQHTSLSLASVRATSDQGHNGCPACSWSKTSISGSPVVITSNHTSTVSNFTTSESFIRSTGSNRLASSRAPPLS